MKIKRYIQETPSAPSLFPDLTLINFGVIPDKKKFIQRSFDLFSLGMTYEGKGYFADETGKLKAVSAPFFFFITPGRNMVYGPKKQDDHWAERFISFSGTRAEQWLENGLIPTEQKVFPLINTCQYLDKHQQLIDLVKTGNANSIDRAKLMTEQLIFDLIESINNQQNFSNLDQQILSLPTQWRNQPEQVISFEHIASKLGISYSLFRKRFKELHKQSPYNYLKQIRLDYCCHLLSSENLRIKEIAEKAGFSYVQSFTKMFTEAKGISPTVYRSQMRELTN